MALCHKHASRCDDLQYAAVVHVALHAGPRKVLMRGLTRLIASGASAKYLAHYGMLRSTVGVATPVSRVALRSVLSSRMSPWRILESYGDHRELRQAGGRAFKTSQEKQ
jgi:hypothetical protein